ncbi:transposase [Kitasatospora sp. NPDC088783]|uniref:transposase n=1 Tax=Kitasatospora sp. NPDC088783 TaxID=3364077 RepID=UPI00382095E7
MTPQGRPAAPGEGRRGPRFMRASFVGAVGRGAERGCGGGRRRGTEQRRHRTGARSHCEHGPQVTWPVRAPRAGRSQGRQSLGTPQDLRPTGTGGNRSGGYQPTPVSRGDLVEYRRHGTVSSAALNVRTGEVLTEVIARNNAVTFTAFLDQLEAVIAADRTIHVVLDNGSSRTAKHTEKRLAAHPRWTAHWTPPHASWLNQIELYFSVTTRRVLRHGDFSSRDDLIGRLETCVIGRDETAAPYRWSYDGTR